MVVRELERDAAQQAAKKQSDAGLLRVLDCFNQGVCFVDTSTAKWQGMHCNSALSEVGPFAPPWPPRLRSGADMLSSIGGGGSCTLP